MSDKAKLDTLWDGFLADLETAAGGGDRAHYEQIYHDYFNGLDNLETRMRQLKYKASLANPEIGPPTQLNDSFPPHPLTQ